MLRVLPVDEVAFEDETVGIVSVSACQKEKVSGVKSDPERKRKLRRGITYERQETSGSPSNSARKANLLIREIAGGRGASMLTIDRREGWFCSW